jgi:hypothetical protein
MTSRLAVSTRPITLRGTFRAVAHHLVRGLVFLPTLL